MNPSETRSITRFDRPNHSIGETRLKLMAITETPTIRDIL
jgi:hypothetical protein